MLNLIKRIFSRSKPKEIIQEIEKRVAMAPVPIVSPLKVVLTASVPHRKKGYLSKTEAYHLMRSVGGRFFTVEFLKKDGKLRIMNCQVLKDQKDSVLGYIKVRETGKMRTDPKNSIRNINLQTVKKLKIKGVKYKVR